MSPGGDEVELFAPPPERRSFSPGDFVRLLVGVVVIIVGAVVAGGGQATVVGLEADLLEAFARFPDDVEDSLVSLAQLVTSAVPIAVIVYLLYRRRFRLTLLLVGTSVMASAAMVLADSLVLDDTLATLLRQLDDARDSDALIDADFPDSTVLASTTALVVVAGRFLSRRWSRSLWWAVATLVFLRLVAVAHPAYDFVLALGVGVSVGSAVLLLFGAPVSEPGPHELLESLRRSGFSPRRIERPDDQAGSAIRYHFVDADGDDYVVTLRTPDERDADGLARFYQNLRYRSSEVPNAYRSVKRRIEHEALLLELASRAGVRVDPVVRIGTTERDSAYLVVRSRQTRPIVAGDLAQASLLRDAWRQLRALHAVGIAHRHLTLETIRVDDDGRAWFTDFDQARTAARDRDRSRDIATLLAETALAVGPDVAVDAAVDAFGDDGVSSALRMLQPLALPPATRTRAGDRPALLRDLRDSVHRRTGEPALEVEDLERIKPRTVLIVGASTLAFYTLLPQLANLEDTVDAFANASFAWIGVVVVLSALSYPFAAISFQGAVVERIPFVPNLRAQLAASFAGLVGPGGAGGFALTARFLERLGVGGAEAGASVAVNVVAGLVVHLSLMVGFFAWAGGGDLDGFSLPDSDTVFLALAALSTVVGLVLAIGPVRRRVLTPVLDGARTALGQIGRVFLNPARVLALFAGSTAVTLTYLAAIAASVQAVGGELAIPQVGAAYLAAVTIAAVSPTPGGLGALETALIAGLTGFGLDAGPAVSATLTFRLATFWLPILPGWATLGWMQRNEEL